MTDRNICGAMCVLRQKPVFLSMALTFSLLFPSYLLQDRLACQLCNHGFQRAAVKQIVPKRQAMELQSTRNVTALLNIRGTNTVHDC